MLSSATPQLFPGYASPTTATFYPTSLPSIASKGPPKPKPVNIFSNDGSFLERFQRLKKEVEDKRKAEEALARKKQFDERFRKRGKRHQPDNSSIVANTGTHVQLAKKVKVDGASLSCEAQSRKLARS